MSNHLKVFILALWSAASSVSAVTQDIEIRPEGRPSPVPTIVQEIEIQPEGVAAPTSPAREIEIQPEGLSSHGAPRHV